MSFFTKIINIYILLSIITAISPSEKNKVIEYCDINQYCNSCTLCGNRTNDYSPCSYYNLFCRKKFTNQEHFQESYLEKYSNFFRNIQNANEFCGQEMYTLDSSKNSFSIISKSNKNIQNSKINHCNYEIHNTKYFNNQKDIANLIIKFNTNNFEKPSLKFIFNILLQNSLSKSSKLIAINETDLINEQYKITLNDYDRVIILLDFYVDKKYNLDIDEYIEIKIDTNNPGNKNNLFQNIIITVIFSVFGVLILTIMNILYYRRTKIREMQIQIEILRQEEIQRKKREEKINKLFKTILILKEFNENDVINDCTECSICLEQFVVKCLICITPCKHIFHYECLRSFIETIKGEKKPMIKCPLCKYDFLEEENGVKYEINNINNQTSYVVVNNNENNNNESNNNQNNINENNNNESNINENNNNENNIYENNNENNAQQNNYMIMSRTINLISTS